MTSPIVLFVYSRPDHTLRTIEALRRNTLASSSDLIVFSDGARTTDKQANVNEVRNCLKNTEGFRSVTIHHRPHNFGLAKSIIEGVSSVLKEHERVIVLEDDLETSPHFLTYMNEALSKFSEDERVCSIHGYVYPVKNFLPPQAFFLRGADCWGWATWRRAWVHFNPDGRYLLDEINRRQLIKEFDYNGAFPFSKMLKDQIKGTNDSWAIRWHASAFLANKLTLYPARSLVNNIGCDRSGEHSDSTNIYNQELSPTPIDLRNVDVIPSAPASEAFEDYFWRSERRLMRRLSYFLGSTLRKVTK